MQSVTVTTSKGKVLVSCHPARARQLMRQVRARPNFSQGRFSLELTPEATTLPSAKTEGRVRA